MENEKLNKKNILGRHALAVFLYAIFQMAIITVRGQKLLFYELNYLKIIKIHLSRTRRLLYD